MVHPIRSIVLLSMFPVGFIANDQLQERIAYAHMRMAIARSPGTPIAPAPLEEYVIMWSSFNEGTLERDSHIHPTKQQVTLKDKIAELARHRDAPGMEYPIMYYTVLFYGERYAYIQSTWATGVPRGEDLYFVRRTDR